MCCDDETATTKGSVASISHRFIEQTHVRFAPRVSEMSDEIGGATTPRARSAPPSLHFLPPAGLAGRIGRRNGTKSSREVDTALESQRDGGGGARAGLGM